MEKSENVKPENENNVDESKSHEREKHNSNDDRVPSQEHNLEMAMAAMDDFINTMSSSATEKDIPAAVDSFPEMVDSLVSKMESSGIGRDEKQDNAFFDAVNQISKSVLRLRELQSNSTWLNRASSVQHRAISLMDEEFRRLLDQSVKNNQGNNAKNSDHHNQKGTTTTTMQKQGSFNLKHESDRCALPNKEDEERFPDFPDESISTMKKIVRSMISARYEAECCMLYEISRRRAFKNEFARVGFESINVEDVQKMTWDSLEGEIASWISIVRHCSTVLFPGEQSFCNVVFSDYPSTGKRLFAELVSAITTRFLDFSGAVVLTKRTSDKLFKFLDMYETLRDLSQVMEKWEMDLTREITVSKSRLGEAAVSIFCELENSIKSDIGRTPIASGAVHPLTRYTMNYLKYACEYKEALEQVFQHHEQGDSKEPETKQEQDGEYKTSAFAREIIRVMDLLDESLDVKSKLYRDPSLRYIFLMNNGRYILQKIKGSTEIKDLMGTSWTRKRSSELRQYHKSYQRETWGRVLQCMNQEGLQVNGKVLKPVLKERFKSFNALFDEIHKTQSTWVVSDEQLQSELRVSISAVMIPAYRSFVGRFKQHLHSGKQADKYIKYQPEDIETLLEELFDGNPNTVTRRRN